MVHKSPVALFVYNRPNLTAEVLAAISLYAPDSLFIISDGPKASREDFHAVNEVRRICNSVNWPCKVKRDYREVNLGCRNSITSGLSWVFSQVDEAIILEDDCLPDITFFRFCSNLLEKYRDDSRIFTIGGFKAENTIGENHNSYYYSKYPCTWGWATWKRSYKDFDPNLADWSEDKNLQWLTDYLGDPFYANYWAYMLTKAKQGSNDWDYAWAYHCWINNALSIRPNINLIQNTGFNTMATHTKDSNHPFGKILSSKMSFPMRHPSEIKTTPHMDQILEDLIYSGIRKRQMHLLYREITASRG